MHHAHMNAKLIVSLLFLFSIFTFEVEAQTRRRRTPRSSSAAITTPSGLTYLITKKGTGRQLKAGDTVVLNYTGTLTNGLKFDSSHDRNEPLEFKLGAGRVIKGWDEGVGKLRVGDYAILVIPGKLAYGPKGIPNVIPPDATLIFVIEVIDVKASPLTNGSPARL
jgi:peptidylprolyl isomerase